MEVNRLQWYQAKLGSTKPEHWVKILFDLWEEVVQDCGAGEISRLRAEGDLLKIKQFEAVQTLEGYELLEMYMLGKSPEELARPAARTLEKLRRWDWKANARALSPVQLEQR